MWPNSIGYFHPKQKICSETKYMPLNRQKLTIFKKNQSILESSDSNFSKSIEILLVCQILDVFITLNYLLISPVYFLFYKTLNLILEKNAFLSVSLHYPLNVRLRNRKNWFIDGSKGWSSIELWICFQTDFKTDEICV